MTASSLRGDQWRERDRQPTPQGNDRHCLGCEAHVSADFARVFGDNEDTIYACLNCATLSALRDGVAVEPR